MMHDLLSLDRRTMAQGIAALLGVALLPTDAFATPKRGEARFLPPARYALLNAVADTILPKTDSVGALDAAVPARLDAMLQTWASEETRAQIDGALTRIDAAARAARGRGFAALTPVERAAVLGPHDEAALEKVPPPPDAPKGIFSLQQAYVADPGYYRLKDLIVLLYYFSEPAATSELVYEHVPGQFEPSIKLTPASRPYLGSGGLV
jgi:hypothetical protein